MGKDKKCITIYPYRDFDLKNCIIKEYSYVITKHIDGNGLKFKCIPIVTEKDTLSETISEYKTKISNPPDGAIYNLSNGWTEESFLRMFTSLKRVLSNNGSLNDLKVLDDMFKSKKL